MILEGIFSILFGALSCAFAVFPDISVEVSSAVFTVFSQIMGFLAYFVPMPTIAAIFSVILSIQIFKILISFLKTIWQILPLT